jgi:hypothetical protein
MWHAVGWGSRHAARALGQSFRGEVYTVVFGRSRASGLVRIESGIAMKFEREFLKLAGVMLACHLRAMGGEIVGQPIGVSRGDLAFSCLGIVDYCGEMRLLCAEAKREAKWKG